MAMVIMSSTDKNGKQTSHVSSTGDNDINGSVIVCGNDNNISHGVRKTLHCKKCKSEIHGKDFITLQRNGKIKYLCVSCSKSLD